MLNSSIQKEVIEKFRVQKRDISSLDIQIGLLSEEITSYEEIIKRKPASSNERFFLLRLKLINLIAERRKCLNLLFTIDNHRYYKIVRQLNLDFENIYNNHTR